MGFKLDAAELLNIQISSFEEFHSAIIWTELKIKSYLIVSKSPILTARFTILCLSKSAVDGGSGTPSAPSIVIWEPKELCCG